MSPFASAIWSAEGLTDEEARRRLAAEGFNDLPRTDHRTFLRIVGDVLREPMFSLLLGAGAIYFVLGDLTEGLVLLAFATISVTITVVQETRSERVLEALRDMTSPRALVIRDGERKRIPGREVVRGDVIVILEGDRIPADAVLSAAHNLLVDESLLTGESAPVSKSAGSADDMAVMARPGGEDQPFVFSGSLVVRGEGTAIVLSTGLSSEIGRIGQALGKIVIEPPQLQQQTRLLVRNFAMFGLAASLLAVLLYGFLRGDWLQAILGGIALGMSMLPEEFPLVLTAFMVMGAWRLSRARVLTRRAAAIEMLGAATVLCTDKTGTLTENRMTIAELRTPVPDGDRVRSARDRAAGQRARVVRSHGAGDHRRSGTTSRWRGCGLCRSGPGPAVRAALRLPCHDQFLASRGRRGWHGLREGGTGNDRFAVRSRRGAAFLAAPVGRRNGEEGRASAGRGPCGSCGPRTTRCTAGFRLRLHRIDRFCRSAARERTGCSA